MFAFLSCTPAKNAINQRWLIMFVVIGCLLFKRSLFMFVKWRWCIFSFSPWNRLNFLLLQSGKFVYKMMIFCDDCFILIHAVTLASAPQRCRLLVPESLCFFYGRLFSVRQSCSGDANRAGAASCGMN